GATGQVAAATQSNPDASSTGSAASAEGAVASGASTATGASSSSSGGATVAGTKTVSGSSGTGTANAQSAGACAAAAPAGGNGGATDTGVSADTIKVGGTFFNGNYLDKYSQVTEQAAKAYFQYVNDQGGIRAQDPVHHLRHRGHGRRHQGVPVEAGRPGQGLHHGPVPRLQPQHRPAHAGVRQAAVGGRLGVVRRGVPEPVDVPHPAQRHRRGRAHRHVRGPDAAREEGRHLAAQRRGRARVHQAGPGGGQGP